MKGSAPASGYGADGMNLPCELAYWAARVSTGSGRLVANMVSREGMDELPSNQLLSQGWWPHVLTPNDTSRTASPGGTTGTTSYC